MYCIINRNGQKWNKFCGFNLKSLSLLTHWVWREVMKKIYKKEYKCINVVYQLLPIYRTFQ